MSGARAAASRSKRAASSLLVALALLGIAAAPAAAREPSFPSGARLEKLHVALIPAAASAETVAVWLELADKGEEGPGGMAVRLAEAEAALTPRARARRLRARVHPLVDERDVPVARDYLDAIAGSGCRIAAVSRWFNRVAVRVPGTRLVDLAGRGFVKRIVPVERARRTREPRSGGDGLAPRDGRDAENRAAAPADYGRNFEPLAQLRLPQVHACGYTGSGVLVCVLDEGFNQHDRHEALRDQPIAPGHRRDFVQGDTIVTDTTSFFSSHGTWVLGCLAANRWGAYVGAAPGVDLALGRTEEGGRETPVEMLYWGMGAEWADSLGADVLTSSLGYFAFDPPFPDYRYEDMDGRTTDVTRAARIAASKGILVVNAVGNEGNTPWRHLIAPADAESVLAVGAVDLFGDTASFSSAGPTADGRIKPDVVARGVSNPLVSTSGNPSAYTTNSGTSFAAPLVAGLVACLLEARPASTPIELIEAVRATASNAHAPDAKRGFGIPDALAALHRTVAPAPRAGDGFFALSLAGENPMRSGPLQVTFWISDERAEPLDARLRVIDVQGRAVRTLWSGRLCVGQVLSAAWDGVAEEGERAGPGVYWLALEGAGHLGRVRIVALR